MKREEELSIICVKVVVEVKRRDKIIDKYTLNAVGNWLKMVAEPQYNNYVGPAYWWAEMYAGRVACCTW